MAESERPKGPGSPRDPEMIHRFSPGDTEEDIKRARGPESRSEPPDIRMSVEGQEPDDLLLEMLRRGGMEAMFGRSSSYKKFTKELRRFSRAEAESEEAKESRERLEGLYDEVLHEGFDHLEEIRDYIFDLKNPYPYDSRWGLQHFDSLEKEVDKSTREAGREFRGEDGEEEEGEGLQFNEEAREWLRSLKRDVVWGKSLYYIMQGLGPEIDYYYDGVAQLGTLKSLHHKITADHLRGAFAKSENLPGDMVPVEIEGITPPESLRETAVQYQDDAFFWKIAVSSAGQIDYENPMSTREAGGLLHSIQLNANERRLIYKVFSVDDESDWIRITDNQGNVHEVPPKLLNFYVTANRENQMNEYKAKLEGLLVTGARGEVAENNLSQEQIDELAERVNNYANIRLQGGKEAVLRGIADGEIDLEEKDLDRLRLRLARVIIDSGIIMDWGFMSSGELAWGWKYEIFDPEEYKEELANKFGDRERFASAIEERLNEKIREIEEVRGYKKKKLSEIRDGVDESDDREVYLLREADGGSIYNAFDVDHVMYWVRHNVSYDSNSETRSNLILPTAGDWRAMWRDTPPYKAPEVSTRNDQVLREMEDILKGDSGAYTRNQLMVRKGPGGEKETFGDLAPEVINYMEKNFWYFETPFYSDHITADFHVKLPVYFPPAFLHLNFWRNFHTKSSPEGPGDSVWQEMLQRKNMSDFDWSSMSPHVPDWYRVNMDMTSRWLGLMVDPHKLSRPLSDNYEKFFAEPSTTSLKELAKRIRLGMRGLEETNTADRGVNEILIIPFLVTLSLIDKYKLTDRKVWDTPSDRIPWRKEVAEWISAAMDLPHQKKNVQPYGRSIALMIFFYATLIERYGRSAADQTELEVVNTKKFVDKQVDKFLS